jgi:hypothetical protein
MRSRRQIHKTCSIEAHRIYPRNLQAKESNLQHTRDLAERHHYVAEPSMNTRRRAKRSLAVVEGVKHRCGGGIAGEIMLVTIHPGGSERLAMIGSGTGFGRLTHLTPTTFHYWPANQQPIDGRTSLQPLLSRLYILHLKNFLG